MDILHTSTGNMIVKGVANHASKEYELSHFLPYLDTVPSQLPLEREGKFILPKPFSYDNASLNFIDLEYEAEYQVEPVYGIKDEFQLDLDPDSVPTPNPRPKWAQKVIEVVGNMNGQSSDKRRTRYQFQNESLALCHSNPLLLERCYKILERCYSMVRYD